MSISNEASDWTGFVMVRACAGLMLFALLPSVHAKSLVDYFQPILVKGTLASNPWGASGVKPRDQDNGIEDKTNRSYSYWDGRILQAKNGKYHMYCSRWNQSAGHNGWFGSSCVHTVSDSILGPYVDKGLCYGDANGQGHNVMVLQMQDGRYAVLISETRRPATVYVSSSLDGPWSKLGTLSFDANGTKVDAGTGSDLHSNTTLWQRADGSFLCTGRHGIMSVSTNGILGPYKVQGGSSVFPNVAGRENTGAFAEDPVLWYSGGQYHMIYNYPDDRYAYHLTSADGIRGWVNRGIAFDPRLDFIRYANGVVNHWYKIERPQVFLRDGHVTHFTFAVIDTEKAMDGNNDNHNSKVIVVPFDGERFDADYQWQPGVDLYKNYDYDGLAAHLVPGSYTRAQLAALGVADNDISSLALDTGMVVELFDQDDFQIPLGTFASGQPNFGTLGINDKVTSLRVSKKTPSVGVVGTDVHPGHVSWTNGRLQLPSSLNASVVLTDSRGRTRNLDAVAGEAWTGTLQAGAYMVAWDEGAGRRCGARFVVIP